MADGIALATRAPAPAGKRRTRPKVPGRGLNAEAQVQAAIIAWLRTVGFPLAFHVPNGGLRSKREAARFKWMGVLAGVPDIVIPLGGRLVFFMEVKADHSCPLRKDQKTFRDFIEKTGGLWACVTSIDEARAALARWGVPTRESAMIGMAS